MATIPTEITFVVGAVLTAAQLNSGMRDLGNFWISGRPLCLVTQSVGQAIPTGAFTPLTFDVETIDRDGMHSTSTNTDRLTAVTPGWYMLGGGVGFAGPGAASTRRGCQWQLNGSAITGGSVLISVGGTSAQAVPARAFPVYLNAGDYLRLAAYQDTGSSLTTGSSDSASTASALWISS